MDPSDNRAVNSKLLVRLQKKHTSCIWNSLPQQVTSTPPSPVFSSRHCTSLVPFPLSASTLVLNDKRHRHYRHINNLYYLITKLVYNTLFIRNLKFTYMCSGVHVTVLDCRQVAPSSGYSRDITVTPTGLNSLLQVAAQTYSGSMQKFHNVCREWVKTLLHQIRLVQWFIYLLSVYEL